MVVVFTLYLKEDVDEDGNIKQGVVGGQQHTSAKFEDEDDNDDEGADYEGSDDDEKKQKKEAKVDTNEDDVD